MKRTHPGGEISGILSWTFATRYHRHLGARASAGGATEGSQSHSAAHLVAVHTAGKLSVIGIGSVIDTNRSSNVCV